MSKAKKQNVKAEAAVESEKQNAVDELMRIKRMQNQSGEHEPTEVEPEDTEPEEDWSGMERDITPEKLEAERLRVLGNRYLQEAERLEHPERFQLKKHPGRPPKGQREPIVTGLEQQRWDIPMDGESEDGEIAVVDGGAPRVKKPGPDPLRFGCDLAKPGENSRYLRYAMASWFLPKIDVSDPEQVKQRIYDYFCYCYDNDRKPNIIGMANWLGVDRQTIRDWRAGIYKESPITPIIISAVNQMEEQWTDYMLNGKVNPASGIFIGKNHYQYRDTQNYVLTPTSPLQDLDSDSAQMRIIEALPDE